MRYDEWDILLFPQDCKTPVREFKTACHVVQDPEFSHLQGSFGIPTVCCFVPSLDAGMPFQLSIHCWDTPSISQFTRSYTKFIDAVKFEARLFIDGRLVASTCFDRKSNWPHIIANSFEFSKNGDLEALKFPVFRQELLQQNYWSPADDCGRIKIIISEGFPRDSLTMPIERVKNIVAFSFQHAPLDVLEDSGIAWPNAAMWQRTPYFASMPVPAYSSVEPETHAHSPRRRTTNYTFMQGTKIADSRSGHARQQMDSAFGGMCHPVVDDQFAGMNPSDGNVYMGCFDDREIEMEDASRSGCFDNSTEMRRTRKSNTDTSMPDYLPQLSDTVLLRPNQQFGNLPNLPTDAEDDTFLGNAKVPNNTPTAGGCATFNPDFQDMGFAGGLFTQNSTIPTDVANTLTKALLDQPMPSLVHRQSSFFPHASEIKSRKEARLQDSNLSKYSHQENQDMRKVSQQMYMPSGSSLPVINVPVRENSPHQFGQSRKASETLQLPMLSTTDAAKNKDYQSSSVEPALRAISGNSTGQGGSKRSRTFTPASAKVIDEEDEPKRASPRIRLSPLMAAIEKADE